MAKKTGTELRYTDDKGKIKSKLVISQDDIETLRTYSGFTEELINKIESAGKYLTVTKEEFREIQGYLDGFDASTQDLVDRLKKVLNEVSGLSQVSRTTRNLSSETLKVSEKISKLSYKGSEASVKDYTRELEKARTVLEKIKYSQEDLTEALGAEGKFALLELAEKNVHTLENRLDEARQRTEDLQEASSKMFPSSIFVGGIAKIFTKIPGLEGIGGKMLEDLKEVKDNVANLHYGFGKANIETLGVLKNLLSWQTVVGVLGLGFAKIWSAFKEVNKAAVDLQRETGRIAVGAAGANFQFATSVDWLNIATTVAKNFHIDPQVLFTNEEIAKMAEAKNMLGLSAEEAATLGLRAKTMTGTMKSYDDAIVAGYRSALAANNVTGSQYKSATNLKDVYTEVAKTSNTIVLSMHNNGAAIAEAVTQARSLGMELKDIEAISSSLINFESSIRSEMEAQLLTGMRLNLAQARQYALANDYRGVMEEIKNQGITAERYMGMNRIQQEGIAKALGMSRDQMSNMLFEQLKSKGYSDEQLANLMKISVEELKAMSITEEWQKATQKLAQAFAPILNILTPIIDLISKIVAGTGGAIGSVLNWVGLGQGTGASAIKSVATVGLLGAGFIGARRGIRAIRGSVGNLFNKVTGRGVAGALGDTVSKASDAATKASGVKTDGLGKLGIGIKNFFKIFSRLKPATIVKALAATGGMVAIVGGLGLALRAFKDLDWSTLGIAGTALGGFVTAIVAAGKILTPAAMKNLVQFALASGVIAGGLAVLGEALYTFSGLDWSTLGIAGAALVPFLGTVALAGKVIGTLSTSLMGALPGLGIFALVSGIIAGSIALLGLSIRTFTKPLQDLQNLQIFNVLGGLAAGISVLGLAGIAGLAGAVGVAAMGGALYPVAKSLRLMDGINLGTLTGIVGGIASLSQVTSLGLAAELTLLGGSLWLVAKSLNVFAEAGNSNYLSFLATDIDTLNDSLDRLDVKKLDKLSEISQKGVKIQREETTKSTVELKNVEKKLDQVITAIEHSKPDWKWVEFDQEYKKSLSWT